MPAGLPAGNPLLPDLAAPAGLWCLSRSADRRSCPAGQVATGRGCIAYLLLFEDDLPDGAKPEIRVRRELTSRLSETLSSPILDEWDGYLWEATQSENLVVGLQTFGDCQEGYMVLLTEASWKEVLIKLLKKRKVNILDD